MPAKAQLKFYDVWGSDQTYPHMSVAWSWGLRHALQMDQAGRLAFWRHAAGDGDVVAGPYQGCRRHSQPVPSRDRHRADDPRSDGVSGARVNGVAQKPIEGGMAYTWDKANADAPSIAHAVFRMFGNRGIYHDGWYATTPPAPPWLMGKVAMPDV